MQLGQEQQLSATRFAVMNDCMTVATFPSPMHMKRAIS